MVRTILYSLWLPVLVIVVSFIRFGFTAPLEGPGIMGAAMFLTSVATLFVLAWPAAIPLTLAVRLLHRRSPVLAYLCALILGAGSVWAVIMGGLFGPVGVVVYALIMSIPAWALLGIVAKVLGGGVGSQPSSA